MGGMRNILEMEGGEETGKAKLQKLKYPPPSHSVDHLVAQLPQSLQMSGNQQEFFVNSEEIH